MATKLTALLSFVSITVVLSLGRTLHNVRYIHLEKGTKFTLHSNSIT